jgi:hypothetical protein
VETTVPDLITDLQQRQAYAVALGELADWMTLHPHLPMPHCLSYVSYPTPGAQGQIQFVTREDLVEAAGDLEVTLTDHLDACGQLWGHYQTGRIKLTLVWFQPDTTPRGRHAKAEE